jgi:hypothetical protein
MKIIHDMKILVANPPAYLYDEGRCYVQGAADGAIVIICSVQ